jgi:hypothetical protein
MANTAAYAGLRQGEEFALTIWQIAPEERVIVDRKVVEVGGSWDHTTRLWRLVAEAGRWLQPGRRAEHHIAWPGRKTVT